MTQHLSIRFDWDEVADDKITQVLGLNADIMNDGAARWDAVAFCLGSTAVVVSVEPDTDQIIVAREPTPTDDGWEPIASFGFAVAHPFGWGWIGMNSQGYKDSFTIALNDGVTNALQPRFTFLAEASSLICFDLLPRRG